MTWPHLAFTHTDVLPGVAKAHRRRTMAAAAEDPTLGSGPDEDYDSLSGDGSDSDSILSDDSVLPDYIPEVSNRRKATTLYRACASNDGDALRRILEKGVMRDEVMEADVNGQVRP